MMRPIGTMKRWWRHAERPAPAVEAPPRKLLPPPGPPPWLEQLDKAAIPRTLTYPSTTLGRMLDQTADRFGTSPAILFGQQTWTYGELQTQVNRAAGGLASLGVRRGDRVLLTLPNCPEFFTIFFAAQKLGAVVVNAGPLMGPDDIHTVLAMARPRVAVGLDLQAPTLSGADHDSIVEQWVWVSLQAYQPVFKRLGYQYKLWHNRGNGNGHGGQHVGLAELLARSPSRPPTVLGDPLDVALLQPTGGTTGILKLAELSHRNLLCNAAQIATLMGAHQGQERILAVLPMFHVYGLTLCLVTGVYAAAAISVITRFNTAEVMETLRKRRPTIFPLVPAICDAISNAIEADEHGPRSNALSGLRLCISGSAPLPVAIAERFERLTGARVVEGYGLTEAGPVTHVNVPTAPRAGSIGLPLPDTQVRVVDLDDGQRNLGPQEAGEMLICAPQVMDGYFANPDATADVLTTDETGKTWLHTGDVVRYDEDGFFYVLDRKKDMIIRSGLKVYPGKVERVLRMHKEVGDVAVVGRADAVHTEMVLAVIVPAGGNLPDQENRQRLVQELKNLCRQHLAPYEVPHDFEFAKTLPRSALGKLLRRELRQLPSTPQPTNGSNGNGKELR